MRHLNLQIQTSLQQSNKQSASQTHGSKPYTFTPSLTTTKSRHWDPNSKQKNPEKMEKNGEKEATNWHWGVNGWGFGSERSRMGLGACKERETWFEGYERWGFVCRLLSSLFRFQLCAFSAICFFYCYLLKMLHYAFIKLLFGFWYYNLYIYIILFIWNYIYFYKRWFHEKSKYTNVLW